MNSSFFEKVLALTKRIPAGRVTTYAALAKAAGNFRAVRAVGNALHQNPAAPRIPCHRVVRSDGSLGGYAFGVKRKVALLEREGVSVSRGKVDLRKFFFRLGGANV